MAAEETTVMDKGTGLAVGPELSRSTVIPPSGTGSEKYTFQSRWRPAPTTGAKYGTAMMVNAGWVTVTGSDVRGSNPFAEAEIGRASGREREQVSVVAGSVERTERVG